MRALSLTNFGKKSVNPKFMLLILLLFAVFQAASGQEYVYVNTDNLILRDRPEHTYMVFAVLHAPCRLVLEPYGNGYANDKRVKSRFYLVSFSYDEDGNNHYVRGWVEKRYVVRERSKVRGLGIDTSLNLSATRPQLYSYMGDDKHNPNKFNAALYQAPRYKGGEPQPVAPKRVYHSGPRGGCYYINAKGKRVYVNSKMCSQCSTQ